MTDYINKRVLRTSLEVMEDTDLTNKFSFLQFVAEIGRNSTRIVHKFSIILYKSLHKYGNLIPATQFEGVKQTSLQLKSEY